MLPTGVCLTSLPPQYPHKCNKCGAQRVYNVSYPYVAYEDIQDPMTMAVTNSIWGGSNYWWGQITNIYVTTNNWILLK